MTSLRQRKGSRGKEEVQTQQSNCWTHHHHQHHHHQPEKILQGDWSWGCIIWTSIGWSVSVGLGLLCCIYVATLHENDLWFSNIKIRVVGAASQVGNPRPSSTQPPPPAPPVGPPGIPRPAWRCTTSSLSCVDPETACQRDMPEMPPKGGVQEAS